MAEGFLVVVAVIVAVVAALVGPIEGRAAADEPARRGRASGGSHDTGDTAPRSAAPSFLLDRGRYLRFDHPLVGDETAANTINDREVIAGGYYDVDGGTHGFVRDRRGRFTAVEVPGALGETLHRINERGQIVGRYSDNTTSVQDPDAHNRAFLLDRGRFVRLDPPDAAESQAVGINNHGQVVGEYTDRAGRYHGYLWRRGRFTTIDRPGAAATSLVDINDRGHILGVSIDENGNWSSFVLRNGRYSSFDVPGAIDLPRDINNRGQIAGFTTDAVDPTTAHGFLLAHGTDRPSTPIDVPGAQATLASGLNDHGQIVGVYVNPAATPNPSATEAMPMDVASTPAMPVGS